MKHSTSTLLAFVLLASITLCSCRQDQAAEIKTETNVIPVKSAPVKHESVTIPVISSGMITSKVEARLSFKTGGIITKMTVEEGQNVRAGQLLATLDLTEINAMVMQAQQNVDKLQRDYERIENLYNAKAATLEQLQNVKTGLEVANQNLTTAKFNQQYSTIYATESGTVIKKLANEGELAAPGNPVYIINSTQKDDWVIRIGVADQDWARIRPGDSAAITLDAYPGESFAGTVSEIADAADPYSGTFQIEVKVAPGNRKFANGLIAKIELAPSTASQLYMIPIEALVECSGNQGYVFKLNEDHQTVTRLPVTVAYFLSNQVALSQIDTTVSEVVTGGSAYLSAGSKVSVLQ